MQTDKKSSGIALDYNNKASELPQNRKQKMSVDKSKGNILPASTHPPIHH